MAVELKAPLSSRFVDPVRFVVPSREQFIKDNPIQAWGDPYINPLLVEPIQISPVAAKTAMEEGFEPVYYPCFQMMALGKLIGEGNEGWFNLKKHQVLEGRIVRAGCRLGGIPYEEEIFGVGSALMHDVTQRLEKEERKRKQLEHQGFTTCIVDEAELFEREWNYQIPNYEGIACFNPRIFDIASVTHLRWEPEKWDDLQKWMRLADTIVTATRNKNGAYGDDYITDPGHRTRLMKTHKSRMDQIGMQEKYYGMSTWDKLFQINDSLIEDLMGNVYAYDPEIIEEYFTEKPNATFIDLLADIVYGKIPLPPPVRSDLM